MEEPQGHRFGDHQLQGDADRRDGVRQFLQAWPAASFPVSGEIPGLTEALQLMKEGGKWQLFVPSNLAYGEGGKGREIGPNATLIFEVELISVK